MPEQSSPDRAERLQLLEEVRQLLFKGMKKAEQERDWVAFNRFAHYYIKLTS